MSQVFTQPAWDERVAAVDLSRHPVWAVTMVRDEEDVIEGTIRHMAGEGVAGIIVADNRSTDRTAEILASLRGELGCELITTEDPEVGYYQSRKMTNHAAVAGEVLGAEWIIPFDADELWLAPHHVARVLGAMPDDVDVVRFDLYHHLSTAVDAESDDPFVRMEWRQREPAGLPKVAFRWRDGATIHAGNHGVDLPVRRQTEVGADGRGLLLEPGRLGVEVRHFGNRSEEQFVHKARNGAEAYAATDLPEGIGAHWRQYGLLLERGGPEALRQVYREHFWYLAPTESGLVRDPAPYRRWEPPAS